jgi:DNA-binding beta-propeller fold protein YncE
MKSLGIVFLVLQIAGFAQAIKTPNSTWAPTAVRPQPGANAAPAATTPPCSRSPVCDPKQGITRNELQRVLWQQVMPGQTKPYVFSYPLTLLDGGGGASSVAITSKGEFWVFQRNSPGHPQLFKFDHDHKMVLALGDDVIGYQEKPHGAKVDPEDNLWICDEAGATVTKISPEGKVLLRLGMKGRRGDWDESKGQRLLWEPLDVAFAANGDVYISEGHGAESPNDIDSADPANNLGVARVLHLDKNGKFLNQWFGNTVGQGKFSMAHGIAVDPRTGNVWIGDREQYRIVIYTGAGKFVKTVQMTSLTCGIAFDPRGNAWLATGQDGQILRIDENGVVLGAIGSGSGTGSGQFLEANYMVWDKQGNLYVGDTILPRVTMIVAGN